MNIAKRIALKLAEGFKFHHKKSQRINHHTLTEIRCTVDNEEDILRNNDILNTSALHNIIAKCVPAHLNSFHLSDSVLHSLLLLINIAHVETEDDSTGKWL